MIGNNLESSIASLATQANSLIGPASWYLFGSARRHSENISDIDLLIVCKSHEMADAFRGAVNIDALVRPIHLSILTEAEERELDFVNQQDCLLIL